MEDSKLDTIKIKEILKDPMVRTVVVSLITILVTLGIIFGVAWYYRSLIFKVLATEYNSILKPISSSLVYEPNANIEDTSAKATITPIAPEEDTVVNAVKKAKPAVVSIIISKEIPKYEVSYEKNSSVGGLGNIFPDSFFQTPVYNQVGTERKQTGSGSGFLISADGVIVTNRHVVSDKTAIYEVQLNNGKKYDATVLARDGVLDVALMKIKASGLPYLELSNSDTLDVGQSVIAIGNSLGEFKNTVSVGVVSGLSRSVTAGDNTGQSERLDKVIQTDAAINPGNSGGPLLNLKGQVIGINVAVVQGSSNVGFALPINSVKSAIDSVVKTGKIARPYVGVRYVNITSDVKAKNNLTVDYGIILLRGEKESDLAVVPGSPADKAGLMENDIILEIDGMKIDGDQNFSSLIRNKKIGDTIRMKVLSNGVEKIVYLKLEMAPENL